VKLGERLDKQDEQIDSVRGGLSENVRLTKSMFEKLEKISADFSEAKGGLKVLEKLGGVLTWAVAIVAAVTAWWLSLKGK
jgi:hypothetical protein